MVEMALVLPIFFTVVLGIVEFGRAMMVGQLITNAAREGARLAIVDGTTNSDVTTYVTDFMLESANVIASDVTVTIAITPATANPAVGDVSGASTRDLVSVDVAVPFNKVSYITGNFLEGKTLSGQSAMRHE
jgi:Flp pilus assembly protein TadG